MAYQLLTGRPPFMAETPIALLRAHIDRPLPPPRSVNPALSEGVEAALFTILAKDPSHRFRSAADFVAALRATLAQPAAGPGSTAPRPAATRPPPASLPPYAQTPPFRPPVTPMPPGMAPVTPLPPASPTRVAQTPGPGGPGWATPLPMSPPSPPGPNRRPLLLVLGIVAAVVVGAGLLLVGQALQTDTKPATVASATAAPTSTTAPLTAPTSTTAPATAPTPDAQATIQAAVAATTQALQRQGAQPPAAKPSEPPPNAKPTEQSTAPPPAQKPAEQPTEQPTAVPPPTAPPIVTVPPLPRFATVTKRYGAVLRQTPSSDAPVVLVVGCGEVLTVVGENGGWFEVTVPPGGRTAYLGGGRTAVGSQRATPDCRGAVTFPPGSTVVAANATTCVGVRPSRSTDAPPVGCYPNGTRLQILNGPIAEGDEDWFYVRATPSVVGWARADFLARP